MFDLSSSSSSSRGDLDLDRAASFEFLSTSFRGRPFARGGGLGPGDDRESQSGSDSIGDQCDEALEDCTSEVKLERAADILFVIDNSGSMGEEQGTLAANFAAFIDVLDVPQVRLETRIYEVSRSRLRDWTPNFSVLLGDLDAVALAELHDDVQEVHGVQVQLIPQPHLRLHAVQVLVRGDVRDDLEDRRRDVGRLHLSLPSAAAELPRLGPAWV